MGLVVDWGTWGRVCERSFRRFEGMIEKGCKEGGVGEGWLFQTIGEMF